MGHLQPEYQRIGSHPTVKIKIKFLSTYDQWKYNRPNLISNRGNNIEVCILCATFTSFSEHDNELLRPMKATAVLTPSVTMIFKKDLAL
jgi:hypothetical protein